MEQIQTQNPETTEVIAPKWYDNQWYVIIAFLLFFPVGVYGMAKNKQLGQILLKLLGIFGILFIIMVASGKKFEGSNSGSLEVSPWDNSVPVVVHYLKHYYLRDPDSYQSVHWYKVIKNNDGTYQVDHTFRARNGYGGYDENTMTFIISSDGKAIVKYF